MCILSASRVVSHRASFLDFLCNIKHNLSTALHFSNEMHITIRFDNNLMTPNVLSGYQHTLRRIKMETDQNDL